MGKNNNIDEVIEKLLYIVKSHNIKKAIDLKKFIYTRNFSEEDFLKMKKVFQKYDEMNVFNCIIFYNNDVIRDKSILIKKIKGVA